MIDFRDPNNKLAKLLIDYDLNFSGKLKAGTIIEIEPENINGWTIGHWRKTGACFAVDLKDVEVVEEAITPRLFYD